MEKDYYRYFTEVKSEIEKKMKDDYEVIGEKIVKNNSSVRHCILFHEKEPSDEVVALPVIYPDIWYEDYIDGMAIEDIVKEAMYVFFKYKEEGKYIKQEMIAPDKMKQNVYFTLVNYEKNRDYLDTVPHVAFLDLAITFYVRICSSSNGIHSTKVTYDMLKCWDMDVDELLILARKNMKRLFPEKFISFKELFAEHLDNIIECKEEIENESFHDIYMLSNVNSRHGAAAVLYSEQIKEFSDDIGCDLVIIPSSIHEVLVVPCTDESDPEHLKFILMSINRETVPWDELLSDNVYIYHKNTHLMSIF